MSLKVRVFEVEIICKIEIVCQYEMHTRVGRCFSFITPAFLQVIDIYAGCILWKWLEQTNVLVGFFFACANGR